MEHPRTEDDLFPGSDGIAHTPCRHIDASGRGQIEQDLRGLRLGIDENIVDFD